LTYIGEAEQIKDAIEAVVSAFGGIDILVNNAFDSTAPFSSVLELSAEQLQRNFDTGPLAYLRTMHAAHPYLKASGEGRVINFGSMAGVVGLVGYTPYNMAKEAVRAPTRTAAREWGNDKITVNNVLPIAETWGPDADVPAPATPLGRFGFPVEDIAPVVLFLASKDHSSSPAPASLRTAALSSTAPVETVIGEKLTSRLSAISSLCQPSKSHAVAQQSIRLKVSGPVPEMAAPRRRHPDAAEYG